MKPIFSLMLILALGTLLALLPTACPICWTCEDLAGQWIQLALHR